MTADNKIDPLLEETKESPAADAPTEEAAAAVEEPPAKATMATKEVPAAQPQPQAPNMATLGMMPLVCILVAVASAFWSATAGDVSPASAQQWAKELFEPHVVGPPQARKNEVVIQFCQS